MREDLIAGFGCIYMLHDAVKSKHFLPGGTFSEGVPFEFLKLHVSSCGWRVPGRSGVGVMRYKEIGSKGAVMKTGPVVLMLMLTIFMLLSSVMAEDGIRGPGGRDGCASINGTELYFRVIGEGEPMVFLHGGPGLFHDYFLPHVESLAGDFQLIFYDQRASGKSKWTFPC